MNGFSAARVNRRVGRKPLPRQCDNLPTAAEMKAAFKRAEARLHIPKLETSHNTVSRRYLNEQDFQP